VIAHDFQLRTQGPAHLEDERSPHRPHRFVLHGLIGVVLAVNIVSTVLSLMV
jgi:hypothetical protein